MGLTYNGVDLSYTLTESVAHSPVWDPSGADQLYTRTTIRVRSVIAPGCLPTVTGETPGDTAARIRHLLTSPRRPLSYSAGGAVVISIPDGQDDANGPRPDPEAFSIRAVTPGSFLVSFAVECRLIECSPPQPYLSLRWTESTSYDRRWLCTRRRTGYLILSSRAGVDPDDLRGLVTPDVPAGFNRISADYARSADNLTYRFTFVDREMMRPPPAPALRVRGKQIESGPLAGGMRKGMIRLRVEGPKGTDASDLLGVALRLGMSRVFAADPSTSGLRVVVGGGVGEDLADDQNAVELHIEYLAQPTPGRVTGGQTLGGLAIDTSWLGADWPGSDPTTGIAPPTRGTADLVRIVAAALNDPCGQSAVLVPGVSGNDLVGVDSTGATVTVTSMTNMPDDDQALFAATSAASPGVYDTYLITARYRDETGRALMPATGVGSAPDTAAVVQVHGGWAGCSVGWCVSRVGGPPEIPPAESTDPNTVYLRGVIEAEGIEEAADGVSTIFTLTGVYEYAFLNRKLVTISAPIPPFLNITDLSETARTAASLVNATITGATLASTSPVSPFTGDGTTSEATLSGSPGVNP